MHCNLPDVSPIHSMASENGVGRAYAYLPKVQINESSQVYMGLILAERVILTLKSYDVELALWGYWRAMIRNKS